MNKFYQVTVVLLLLLFCIPAAFAQTGVLNPNDPIVVYDSANPPAIPPYGTLAKWVKTTRVSWNSSSFKAYYYNGLVFRVKFPKTYQPDVNDGKKYPMIIFFHGIGEKGSIYDNEYQLYNGGQVNMNAVDQGKFDGFLVYPQNQQGFFGNPNFDDIVTLINEHFIPECKVDPFRIIVNGLSGGGTATWDFLLRYPKVVAAATPISAANSQLKNYIDLYKWTPIWWFQGGVDTNPAPGIALDDFRADSLAGANVKLTVYPGQGHGVWNLAWNESDYYPFVNRAYKSNPWPLYGRTDFCPGENINVTLGLTAGFDAYEWRKDGVVISGATSNTLTVTSVGSYTARIKDGSTWSDTSHIPVVIKIKTATVSPDITVAGLASNVIPSPDGKTSVSLQVPATYASYTWRKLPDTTTVLGSTNTLTATTAGKYVVKVTEQYGCSSSFSNPFTVIAAQSNHAPDPASNLTATAISKTAITLQWSNNPNPAYNEKAFEVYSATNAGGPYTLTSIVSADTLNYTDNNLNPNTKYFYIIRAVNDSGAAPVSNEASTITQTDTQAPTAPVLSVGATSRTSISLQWDASTDDVAVDYYDIYVNGVKTYTVDGNQTSFTVAGLTFQQSYNFVLKARDFANNISAPSNQVSAYAISKGLTYSVYAGTFSKLPDFTTLTPVSTGTSPTVSLTQAGLSTNYAMKWQGYIRIPVAGSYTFETSSDDGSALYIGNYGPIATALVNNDGGHGTQTKEGTITLDQGVYPITITYFQGTGGSSMKVLWKNTANGVTTEEAIPAAFFTDTIPPTSATVPLAPINIKATAVSYNKINLTWTDTSNNETNFEIYRATSSSGPYLTIARVGANVTSYSDSALTPQTTYFYRVDAINNVGNSGFDIREMGGLHYNLYQSTTTLANLPNFLTMAATDSGYLDNVSLAIRSSNNNFALKFGGYITIPTTGSYTFYTNSDDGSNMYLGGFPDSSYLIVKNDKVQGNTEKASAALNLTAGSYPFFVTYFQGSNSYQLGISWKGPGITKQNIPSSAFLNPNNNATTLALPPAPDAPSELTATTVSASAIHLKWNDNSNNETGFEIYRSVANNTSYTLLQTVNPSDSATGILADTALFPNVTYYYKVRAKGVGGNSAFSNETSASTLNTTPVISPISSRYMKYGTTSTVNVSATDADGKKPSLTASNLPAFGTFVDNGNGTGIFTFSPDVNAQGTYANITVTAANLHDGSSSTAFTLTVNATDAPVLSNTSDITLAANATGQQTITVTTSADPSSLTWGSTGLPGFAALNTSGKNATLTVTPTLADAGTYPVTIRVDDGAGGLAEATFNIVVTSITPNYTLFVNWTDGAPGLASAPWNNTNKRPVLGDVYGSLKDSTGRTTGVAINVLTAWQNVNSGVNSNNQGYTSGNNSGLYPDKVTVSSVWTTSLKQTFKLTGLSQNHYKYNFTFYGSRAGVTDNRTASYTINGNTVTLNGSNNVSNTVSLNGMQASAAGEISVDLQAASGSSYAYLNAMIVRAAYDDSTAPAKPRNLNARVQANGIRLNWIDAAYNESGYNVFRATTQAGPYQQLSPNPNVNDTAYTDVSAIAGIAYYYVVTAYNNYGITGSDTVSAIIANRAPSLTTLSKVSIKTDTTITVGISATDDPGDVITLSVSGLPAFATFQDNGNGNGNITLAPHTANIGKYTVTISATDNHGAITNQVLTIQVSDKNITSTYVDFNQVMPASAPWTSFNAAPSAGVTLSNLLDESGTHTGINITLLDALSGSNTNGATTGNNSGIYPDTVLATYWYDQSGTAKRLRLLNVPANRKYNLIFIGSRASVSDNRNTIYTSGGQSVTLNAAGNTATTVQLNGLSPDSNGIIEFTIAQASGSFAAYLNAMVIQSYVDNGIPLAPANLTGSGISRSTIKLSWADNSNNETGFDVYRSNTRIGEYTKIGSVAANVNTYSDSVGLSPSTIYYYQVKTVNGTQTSDFSNVAAASTMAWANYINFNTVNPAPAPWNNTTSLPYVGLSVPNMKDDEGNATSQTLTITRAFTGTNPAGKVTGNNSGVYPDLVLAESYYVEPGDTAEMTITGLNQAMTYTFTFFGDRVDGGSRVSAYKIGNQIVTLEANNNVSNTVQIAGVVPDQNGNIKITVYIYANYAYLNALVIQAFPSTQPNLPTLQVKNPQQKKGITLGDISSADNTLTVVNVYPNPIQSTVYVSLHQGKQSSVVALRLYDLSGHLVAAKDLGNVTTGSYLQRLDVSSNRLASGYYLLQIIADGQTVKTIKLFKN
ncbi:Fibronectin type III domain-containing protein [Chitinophaga costaii]|uniref:Fibronectin type III domain-containing protein n=1 Tax=Chitinophaga costaii TaxID=1335309 RepID=A0A1C4FI05_9BACT|nr:fibronectin type III domain-containing protein [Chitinophaga costaii]PUZ20302.1 T9SS C-terminal target domain-containing protein [Chitinophaga costaii]SCC55638.1 Fibronectin type III domain-containing protein [Chitinophaga costaii]